MADVAPHNTRFLDPSRARPEAPTPWARIVRMAGATLFAVGLAMGCYATIHWLQTGDGGTAVVYDVVGAQLPPDVRAWIADPDSWRGLHMLVVWFLDIPLYASAAIGGFLLLLSAAAAEKRIR